jgi:ABC-2 type transport system permease protein
MTVAEAAVDRPSVAPRRSTRNAWLIVFKQEVVELWVGGRAINLLILYSLLLGLLTFLLATNTELNLIPPKEMVFLTLLNTISFGVFIGMIVGADGISGERERGTLEVLLLTPTSRRQLIFGKLLSALTPWPAAFLISLPALFVVAQGDEVFGQAVLLGAIIGTALAIAFASFGLLVSTWSNANKTSMFVCLIVWLLLFMMTQLPGEVQKGDFGYFVQRINPLQATSEFMEKVLVNHRTLWERDEFLRSTVAVVVLVPFILFVIAAPRLRLTAGRAQRLRARWGSLSGMVMATLLFVAFVAVMAAPTAAVGRSLFQTEGSDLDVSLEEKFLEVRTGDEVNFDTLLENNGTEDSPPVIVAMNIIKLSGDVVDPEDWSPERTQKVDFVPAGDQIRHSWTIEAILKGDYMVYFVAVPEPGETSTSRPVSSPGLHLTVGAFQRLNPQGVLPVVIAVPLGVTVALLVLVRLRLRRLGRDAPDDEPASDSITGSG